MRLFQVNIVLCCLALGLISCKQSAEVIQKDSLKDKDRERALQHYIEGLVYDQKGEYAKAILEYQDALRYDNDPAIYFAISKDYSILGKHALAAQMGQQAIAQDRANRTYHENLAEIYLNAFEIEKAITVYENLVKLDSSYVEGWYNLARLYQMRRPLKAIDMYQTMLERFGSTWDVYVQLMSLYTSMGKFDEAADVVGKMTEIDPGNYELRRTLASLYLQSGKKDQALTVYLELLERDPHDLEVRAAIAHVYLLQQQYERAAEQLESVLRSPARLGENSETGGDTLSVETQLRFGQYFASFLQKDSTVAPYAFNIFEKIRRNYPDDWRPYWFLGVIAGIMHDDSAAISNLERVTELDPKNPDGWVYYVSYFLDRNDYQRGVQILERAATHVPNEARIHFLLGISYHRLKQTEHAAHVLERAIELNPKDVNALGSLALVYDELKRYEDSDRLYEEALKLDSTNHLILNNYGYSLAERGEQLERALVMSTEAVRQKPENSSYLDTIGWVYFKLGNYEDAERFILKAIEHGDASPVVLEHMGDVYAKLGQKEKAVEYWQKALDRDDTNQSLRAKIMRGSL
jgi:tetratricopeptide (TPR) repeat protein